MSAMIDGFIKLETLEQIVATVKAKGQKGFAFTASLSDTTNEYGQNVSFFAAQSKEERESQKKKFYFGNGKVFWMDANGVSVAKKKEEAVAPPPQHAATVSGHDLPF